MATYYVSKDGNDANDGLGPDASDASHKPLLTVAHAIVHAASADDIVYIAPGIYREYTQFGNSGSSGHPISFIGDPLNSRGFKDASGGLVRPDHVVLTNFITSDVANSGNSSTVDLNSKSYLTISKLWIENISATPGFSISAASVGITVSDCVIENLGSSSAVGFTSTAGTSHSILFDRCVVVDIGGHGFNLTATKHTAEYDIGFTIRNCTIMAYANNCVYLGTGGSGTDFGTGLIVQNCTMLGSTGVATGTGFNASVTAKVQVKNSLILCASGLKQTAGAAGDVLVEDYNFLVCSVPRTTVNTGSNSKAFGDTANTFSRSVRHDWGQSQIWGFASKSFMAPWSTSRTIGYGNDSTPTALAVDLWNRPRPSGSGVAAASVLASVGAHELHEYGTKDTAVKDASDASLKLVGPGDHEFIIPVGAAATVISIKVRYDTATYDPTNKPRAILFDPEGFAAISGNIETLTASVSAADAWETLTFTTFTPTRKGVVRLRLVNRGTGADDVCWFDTMTIS